MAIDSHLEKVVIWKADNQGPDRAPGIVAAAQEFAQFYELCMLGHYDNLQPLDWSGTTYARGSRGDHEFTIPRLPKEPA